MQRVLFAVIVSMFTLSAFADNELVVTPATQKCVAKTKQGKCLTLKEVQALIEAGADISELLPATESGESLSSSSSFGSGSSSGSFGATPSSTFSGGGGGVRASRS